MPRKLLTIKFDGSNYAGWQYQPNAVSVQQKVTEALETVVGRLPAGITGCSRTDSGVHANMFCLHFDTESSVPDKNIVLALNTRLPNDISAVTCVPVPDDFHARYSCTGKNYIYKINNSSLRDPFLYKYSLRYDIPIDAEILNKAAQNFCGTQDFSGFCSKGSGVKTTVRTVKKCSVTRDGDIVTLSITADGFLYNMVRIIVGTLLYVNEKKIDPDDLPYIIESKNRDLAGPTARPEGLFLNEVFY